MRANNVPKCKRSLLLTVLVLTVLWLVLPALASDEDTDEKLTIAQKQSIIQKVAEAISESYVYEDTALEMAAFIHRALKNGDYDDIENLPEFCRKITHDLRKVSDDRHLEVSPYQNELDNTEKPNLEEILKRLLPTWRKENFGFKKVELLDGNIGFIDLRLFGDARYAGPTAIAALNFVAHCDALIIDLRANTGGSPCMIQLICSYLFDAPTHIGGFYLRKSDSIQQFWTQACVSGPRLTNVPVYILVSDKTFSAAEGFAYILKDLQRATIVGETTAGGANPQMPHYFPDESITVKIPFGKAVSPISKDNWEGKGVVPDVPVPASEALEVAQLTALRDMLDKEEDENARRAIQMIIKEVEARRN